MTALASTGFMLSVIGYGFCSHAILLLYWFASKEQANDTRNALKFFVQVLSSNIITCKRRIQRQRSRILRIHNERARCVHVEGP